MRSKETSHLLNNVLGLTKISMRMEFIFSHRIKNSWLVTYYFRLTRMLAGSRQGFTLVRNDREFFYRRKSLRHLITIPKQTTHVYDI